MTAPLLSSANDRVVSCLFARRPRQTTARLGLLLSLLAAGACQPALRPSVGVTPAHAPPQAPAGSRIEAPAPTPVTPIPVAVPAIVPVPSEELLAKTVTSVFGEKALVDAEEEPSFDLDIRSYETHERVLHYIDLFSGSAKERFTLRLSRGTRYEPMIRTKLRNAGMPEDLTFLALIESGYDPHAYSKAAAVGMWQFMSTTARDVGMRVDWWMDERRDPARSTDGAIRFLADLQRQFGGSMYLAAAAYNGGPGRVARGLTRFADEMEGSEGEDRFFALAEQDYLRSETKNYVPQLIAAALVAKMPARYGLSFDSLAPYAYDSVRASPGTSLAAVSAASAATVAELRDLNPAILRGVTPPDASIWVHVPVGSAERTANELSAMTETMRLGYRTARTTGKESLAAIAKKDGIATRQLAWFNPGLRTSKKTGRPLADQTLRIPREDVLAFAIDVPDPGIERYGGSSSAVSKAGVHVVKRGETLNSIAKRYGLTTTRLKSINGLKRNTIVAGQTLRLRSGSGATSSNGKATSSKTSGKAGSTSKKAPTRSTNTTATKKSSSTKGKTSASTKKKPPVTSTKAVSTKKATGKK